MVDASVAVKWWVPEPGSDQALALVAREALWAPDLIVPECGNILWKKLQRKEIRWDEALAAVQQLLQSGLRLRDSGPLLARGMEMAHALAHPAYDCLYLSLAETLGTQLITADLAFVRRVAAGPKRWRNLAVAL